MLQDIGAPSIISGGMYPTVPHIPEQRKKSKN
jgi:hypothetical protein